MKAKKLLVLGLCMTMIACISITATLAYFTDTDSVTNTFTVGHVEITLDEENVDGKDAAGNDNSTEERDIANDYKLYPGKSYDKDPIVHIDDESEDCFVFVKVTNGIEAIEADYYVIDEDGNVTTEKLGKIADQMTANGWFPVEGEENIFYYQGSDGVQVVTAGEDLTVFTNFKIDSAVDNIGLAAYENATVEVVAYAIQAEGFADAQTAWASYKAQELNN